MALAGVVLALVVVALVWGGPRVAAWWTNYRDWRQVIAFTPDDTKSSIEVRREDTQDTFGNAFVVRARPNQFQRLMQLRDRLSTNRPSRSPGPTTALFQGPLQTATGHRRLLAVESNASWGPRGAFVDFDVRCFMPGSMFSSRLTEVSVKPDDELRIRGGIPNFPGQLYDPIRVGRGHAVEVFPAVQDKSNTARAIGKYVINGLVTEYVIELHEDDRVTLRDGDGNPLHEDSTKPR